MLIYYKHLISLILGTHACISANELLIQVRQIVNISIIFHKTKNQKINSMNQNKNMSDVQNNVLVLGSNLQLSKSSYIVEYVVSLSGSEIQKIYVKHQLLGRGGFSNCYITQLIGSSQLMATKVVNKNNLKSSRSRLRLVNEIKIHKTFTHPNIVQFIHHFEDYDNVYIMLELCENQSLNQLLKERKILSIPEVQSFIYGICNGIKYLHDKKYIHRDLKLANIFLNDKFQVKIGDFGLTSQIEFLKQNKRTICGTPNYIAPEVLEGIGYYFQIDIWGIGIIMYTLLYGFPPFESDTTAEIYTKVRKCQYYFPKNKNIPIEAIQLLKSILVSNPQKRPTLDQIMNSQFMRLGGGVPLQLPEICYERAPTKAELQKMQTLKIKNKQEERKIARNNYIQKGQEEIKKDRQKSTIDKTVSRDCNNLLTGVQFEEKIKVGLTSEPFKSFKLNPNSTSTSIKNTFIPSNFTIKKQPLYLQFVKQFDKVDEASFYFCTNNFVLGTFQKNREICFMHLSSFQLSVTEINQVKLYNNLFSEVGTIPYANYKYKPLLNLKSKQMVKQLQKQNLVRKKQVPFQKNSGISGIKSQTNLTYVTKISQHKGVTILKLSNKSIQLIYQAQNHIFLYDIQKQKLFFYEKAMGNRGPLQLNLSQIKDLIGSISQNDDKLAKVQQIQISIEIVGTHEYLKFSVSKLKQIFSLISELQNKKAKHSRNRNSQ